MNWIDVNDELPPMLQTVLLAFAGGVTVGWRESFPLEEISFYSCELREWPESVSHWMYLPQHPHSR